MESTGSPKHSVDLVRDAISAHATPGASIDEDGPLAFSIRADARAVPDGRFALLAKSGFTLAVRVAPRPR